jgi:hypothetical protein
MKKYFTLAVIALFGTAAISIAETPSKDAVMAKENAAWQAYKDRKADDFKKLVDKDVRLVYADGVGNMDKEVSEMPKWNIKSFTISNYDIFSDEKDVIVATYTVKLDATFDGKDMSGTYVAGTVWKLEGTDWLAIFHSHVKQEMAIGDAQRRE